LTSHRLGTTSRTSVAKKGTAMPEPTKLSLHFETLIEAETKASTLRDEGFTVEVTRSGDFRYIVVATRVAQDSQFPRPEQGDAGQDVGDEDSDDGYDELHAGDDEPY
jgi:hypothetical protein